MDIIVNHMVDTINKVSTTIKGYSCMIVERCRGLKLDEVVLFYVDLFLIGGLAFMVCFHSSLLGAPYVGYLVGYVFFLTSVYFVCIAPHVDSESELVNKKLMKKKLMKKRMKDEREKYKKLKEEGLKLLKVLEEERALTDEMNQEKISELVSRLEEQEMEKRELEVKLGIERSKKKELSVELRKQQDDVKKQFFIEKFKNDQRIKRINVLENERSSLMKCLWEERARYSGLNNEQIMLEREKEKLSENLRAEIAHKTELIKEYNKEVMMLEKEKEKLADNLLEERAHNKELEEDNKRKNQLYVENASLQQVVLVLRERLEEVQRKYCEYRLERDNSMKNSTELCMKLEEEKDELLKKVQEFDAHKCEERVSGNEELLFAFKHAHSEIVNTCKDLLKTQETLLKSFEGANGMLDRVKIFEEQCRRLQEKKDELRKKVEELIANSRGEQESEKGKLLFVLNNAHIEIIETCKGLLKGQDTLLDLFKKVNNPQDGAAGTSDEWEMLDKKSLILSQFWEKS